MEINYKMTTETKKLSLPCSLEKDMGSCVWGWVEIYQAYMCSICGNEFLKPLTRKQLEQELKNNSNYLTFRRGSQ